ncbi:MAG: hypothetical protein IJC84_04775 [Clostridia bacterium]|nr:hypothetical protein [Clostridia bacterium]
MKRIFAMALALLMLLSTVSCGGGSLDEIGSETATQPATGGAQNKTEEVDTTDYPTVLNTNISQQIAALPIANASMSEDELRQLCLDFFQIQLTFAWTPNKDFSFDWTPGRKDEFEVGTVYGGIPYVHSTTNSLYDVLTYYDEETGVMDIKAMGKEPEKLIGNQCSGGSYWGWARVSNTMHWSGTYRIVASRGAIPLGPYKYDTSIDDFTGTNSLTICKANGEQTMFQSYAQLKKADGLVYYTDGGHVMMAVSSTPVYKDGKIDAKESYVMVQEQVQGRDPLEQSDGSAIHVQKGRLQKHTYEYLYQRGYVPFTLAEFHGQDPVEKGEVSFSYKEASATMEQLTTAKLSANYSISHVKFTVLDKEGNEAMSKYYYLRNSGNAYDYSIDMVQLGIIKSSFTKYITEGATARIDVQIGNGEFLCAWQGAITK